MIDSEFGVIGTLKSFTQGEPKNEVPPSIKRWRTQDYGTEQIEYVGHRAGVDYYISVIDPTTLRRPQQNDEPDLYMYLYTVNAEGNVLDIIPFVMDVTFFMRDDASTTD